MPGILRQTTVARDGMHNGFTDLQCWQGCYWVGYRKGAAHATMDGEAVVAMSADRTRFREVAHLHVPGDNRDPKLFPIDENRMALFFPSWPRGAGGTRPAALHFIESDIFWHADGEAWIVARSVVKREGSYFCSARPPYTDWQVTELEPMVHAPVFLHHEGELYVAGRCQPSTAGNPVFPFPRYSLGIWRVKRARLEPVLHLPATGDCSYPGLIKDPDGRICLTYYSQHAYDLGVLRAPDPDTEAADVYFAELEL